MTAKCYWITGLSASGKTTISTLLVNHLRSTGKQIIHLDGDELRQVLAENAYTRDDRISLGMRYARLCQLINSQGVDVVIAVIGLYKEIHNWNRYNIAYYTEIYIDTPLDELIRRDPKGLYKGYLAGEIHNVAGMDLEIDVPENPHILLQWSNGRTEESMFNELLKKIQVI
jgi:adenylylsulfate kinase